MSLKFVSSQNNDDMLFSRNIFQYTCMVKRRCMTSVTTTL